MTETQETRTALPAVDEDKTLRVGLGVTEAVGSDRYPGTITAVSPSGKKITVQMDDYRRTDSNGYGGHQEYEYFRDENNYRTREYSLRKNGEFVEVGSPISWGRGLTIGMRRAYQDPSF